MEYTCLLIMVIHGFRKVLCRLVAISIAINSINGYVFIGTAVSELFISTDRGES